MNTTAAISYCQANGMQLYSILTDLDYDLLETLAAKTFPTSPGALLINGIRALNGTWFTGDSNPKPLFSGVHPTGSGCLVIDAGPSYRISFRGLPCNTAANIFCEFY
jgi:hypothetical protein